jgi:hypothetical protein
VDFPDALDALAARVRPAVAATGRLLPVAPPLGPTLPGAGLRRGATIVVDGPPGAGSTSVALTLAAAATATGEWAAVVDPEGTLGARAAAELGVELERCAVVRGVPAGRFGAVVAALLDGVSLVVATVPTRLRAGEARRLIARARERGTVLVALGRWPAEAALRLRVEPGTWERAPSGLLAARDVRVTVEGRGAPARRHVGLARAG